MENLLLRLSRRKKNDQFEEDDIIPSRKGIVLTKRIEMCGVDFQSLNIFH